MRITEKERATRERNSPNETAKGSVVARCSTWPDKRKPEERLEKSPHNRDIDHFVEEDTQLGTRGASYVPLAQQCTCGTLILSICTQDPNQFVGLTAPL